jgi:hypothetical protein
VPLSQELMALMLAWQTAGFPEFQAPPPPVGEPIASAEVSGDFNVPELSRVTLDGSGSRAGDGTLPERFLWTQIEGPPVILVDPQTAAPSFIAPDVNTTTRLVFELTIIDSGAVDTATVVVNVLDRSGTSQAQNQVTYDDDVFPRVFQPFCLECHSAQRTGADRFGAPPGLDYDTYDLAIQNANETLAVGEVVAGTMPPGGALSQELMALMLSWQAAGFPEAQTSPLPVGDLTASAGVSGNFNVQERSRVTLDGSDSRAADGTLPERFLWTQTDGPRVILVEPESAAPSFISPDVDTTTRLVFELTVIDSGAVDTATVTVNVFDVVQPFPENAQSSSGGCVMHPGARFDPVLVGLVGLWLASRGWRRLRRLWRHSGAVKA